MVIQPRRLYWAGYAWETRNIYIILVGKNHGNWPLWRLSCRWEDKIKIDISENGHKDMRLFELASDIVQWQALVMKQPILQQQGICWMGLLLCSVRIWVCVQDIYMAFNSTVDVAGTSMSPCLVTDPASQWSCWHHLLALPSYMPGTGYICLS
jgi:hypothetical protein